MENLNVAFLIETQLKKKGMQKFQFKYAFDCCHYVDYTGSDRDRVGGLTTKKNVSFVTLPNFILPQTKDSPW